MPRLYQPQSTRQSARSNDLIEETDPGMTTMEAPAFQLTASPDAPPNDGDVSMNGDEEVLQRTPPPGGPEAMSEDENEPDGAEPDEEMADPYHESESFTYDGENRERPTRVQGPIVKKRPASGRPKTPTPLAILDSDGLADDDLVGYHGGHLHGLQNGGQNKSQNVVPMLPRFNSPVFKNLEDATHRNPNARYIDVTVDYGGDDDRVPSSITMKTYDADGGNELTNDTVSQPDDIPPMPEISVEDEELIDQATSFRAQNIDISDRQQVWRYRRYLEAMGRDYPKKRSDSPYFELDMLWVKGEIGGNLRATQGFDKWQRDLILKFNCDQRGGGNLVSDDPADRHQTLSVEGAADFPEIDHIIPKSNGGGNWFSNARVVSWQHNNKDQRLKNDDLNDYKNETGSDMRRKLQKFIEFELIRFFKAQPNQPFTKREIKSQILELDIPWRRKDAQNDKVFNRALNVIVDSLPLEPVNPDESLVWRASSDYMYRP